MKGFKHYALVLSVIEIRLRVRTIVSWKIEKSSSVMNLHLTISDLFVLVAFDAIDPAVERTPSSITFSFFFFAF